MDSFFTQSSSWKRQPASGPFDFISRRSYGHTPYFVGPNPGVMRTVWTMIGINTIIFGAWQHVQTNKDAKLQRRLYEETTLSEGNLQAGRGYTMITSAFSQKDLGHFIFNMVGLHTFGSILSIVPGISTIKFMSLAFGSAAAGSLAWLYHMRTKERSQQRQRETGVWGRFGSGQVVRQIHVALGASGMVMGLGAAATCLAPMAPMMMFLIPVRVPLFVLSAVYFGLDAYALNSSDGVGHSAHLGGSLFGAAFYVGLLRNYGGIWTMLRRGLR